MSVPPVALVGPTASGKSDLAQQVARRLAGTEIVSVDSMCAYRFMDIGTAKPSAAARRDIRHHLIDLVDPDQEFSVAEFQRAAGHALADIEARGARALLVGGTGLYLRAVVDDLALPGRWPDIARSLEAQADDPGGVGALHARLHELDPLAAARTTPSNRRRIIRALEVTIGSGQPFSSFGPGLGSYPETRFTLVGLPFDPEAADHRIEERFRCWVAEGLVDEVRALAARPAGLSRTARQALGYRELLAHVEDGLPLDEAIDEAIRRTRSFARRQWAWFRRDPRIRWIEAGEDPARVLAQAMVVHGER
jgi:tRNA dimethylallyltransferase